jgi:chloramphenicol 3-O phosphotransferase
MTARIIMLNGTSSVGKTTLVAELRPLLPDTFCYYASDQLADEGFRPTAPVARLHGREAFFDGFHQSIASFASAGLDMLVEHIVEKASWRADLDRLLSPFDVFWVGMFAPIEELEQRERVRGNRTIGEAREHFATHDYCSYDFSIHTTQPANVIASQVSQAWRSRQTLPR